MLWALLIPLGLLQDAAGPPARDAAVPSAQNAAGSPARKSAGPSAQGAAGSSAQGAAGPSARAAADAKAQAAFASLPASEQADLVEYFRAEALHLGTFQASLVAFVLGEQELDPKAWPEEPALSWFDAQEHTPENVIARHPLEPDAPAVKTLAASLAKKGKKPRFESAWSYDYAGRGLARSKGWKDPARIFRNGLAGAPPDLDLAQALVERALDDGEEQKSLAAFAHAYTDRDGGVYPGISLYDAWSSGVEIETPDVDTLGIVHTVLDDWKTWKAPVPAPQQEKLFDKIGEVFVGAQRHRELRHALASTYLEGSPVLPEAYAGYVDNFHALWEDVKSTPKDLEPKLPAAAKRDEFLAAWTKTCRSKKALWSAALARHRTLDDDGESARALLLRLLEEFAPKSGGKGH